MGRPSKPHHIVHESHEQMFPWRWFIFFCLCLLGGGEGLFIFAIIFGIYKGFTKLIRF